MRPTETSMRSLRWLFLAAAAFGLSAAPAGPQAPASGDGPDPREIQVPPIRTAMGRLPGVTDLPARVELPDVLTSNDGRKITDPRQWSSRRAEMRRILEYYAVGQAPPPPGNVSGREVRAEAVL